MSKSNKIISHARALSEDKEGLIVALTKDKELLVLGRGDNAKIATEVGKEWFEDSAMSLDQYKETIVDLSDYELVKEINTTQKYQDQLKALDKEKTLLEEDFQKVQNNELKTLENLEGLEELEDSL
jgi:hypothetical protein